nr:ABC transporter permease [Methanomassiliicoccus luminyensis]
MLRILDESLRVAWSDLCYLKRNFLTVTVTILVTPLLYFIAFGYGLGSQMDTIEGVSYIAFVIPGIVSLSTLNSTFSSTANKIMVQRKFYSSFDEILLCPISPSSVILGKTTVGFLKGVIGCFVLIALGMYMSGDVHMNALLAICVLVSCFTFSLLGVLAGFVVKGLPTMTMFTSLVIVPMTFLCGTLFSVSSMPAPVRYVISVLPLTHVTACIRAAALEWAFPMGSFVVLIGFGVAFFLVSYYLLKSGKV